MILLNRKLYAPEPTDPGAGEEVIDRGDDLDTDIDPDDPDAESVKDDPKVKELETEIKEDAQKKDSRIPLARHKEILEKERDARAALERQLAQYQRGDQLADMNAELTAAENKVEEMLKEHTSLVMDGESEKAMELMRKIRKLDHDMAEAKSDMKIHAAEIRAAEKARYATAIERVEAAFPELNPDHEEYDQDSANEVLDLMEAYKSRGMTPTAALQKAVKMIVEPRTTRQQNAVNTQPRVADKDVAAERKKAAVTKTSDAVRRTPASVDRVGIDSDRLGGGELDPSAVMRMSQAEFAKLSEATLAKMRGDDF